MILRMRRYVLAPVAVFIASLAIYSTDTCKSYFPGSAGSVIDAVTMPSAGSTEVPLLPVLLVSALSSFDLYGDSAANVNATAALFGATGAAFFSLLLLARHCSIVVSVSGGMITALSSTLWVQSVQASVYGLTVACIELMILFGLAASETRSIRHLLLLAFVVGFGVAVDLTVMAVLPGLSVLAFRCGAPISTDSRRARLLLYVLVFTAAGIVAFGSLHYNILASHGETTANSSRFIARSSAEVVSEAAHLFKTLLDELGRLPLLMALLGMMYAYRTDRSMLTLATSTIVCGCVWEILSIGDRRSVSLALSPVTISLSILVSYGLQYLIRSLIRPINIVVGGTTSLLIPLLLFTENKSAAEEIDSTLAEDYAVQVLHTLPIGSFLFLERGIPAAAVKYLYGVEGVRMDLSVVEIHGDPWKGLTLDAEGCSPLKPEVLQDLIEEGESVYYLPNLSTHLHRFELRQLGLVYEVSETGDGASGQNVEIGLPAYSLSRTLENAWLREIYATYLLAIGDQRARTGQKVSAADAYRWSAELAHDSARIAYLAAERLIRVGDLFTAWIVAHGSHDANPAFHPTYVLEDLILSRFGIHSGQSAGTGRNHSEHYDHSARH